MLWRKSRSSGGFSSSRGIQGSAVCCLVSGMSGAVVKAVRWWSGMSAGGVGTVSVRPFGWTSSSLPFEGFGIAPGRVSVAGITWFLPGFRYRRVTVVDLN